MKNVSLVISIFITAGLFSYGFAENANPARPIQIITSVNQTLQLQLNELKDILETDDIKDRHVMVVSIVGASRTGKSFLLNFFIRYLNAQYKKHNVSDWIAEDAERCELRGFKWRYGQNAETMGIWMWSEIFTHDFENGEKVAIILLDTQGLFDKTSTKNYYSSIVALNMMISSVQCYNVMLNIQQDSLEHLELFAARGRFALQQLNQKPFQKLLFIVRDWHYADEVNYGWNGQQVVDELLSDGENQQSSELSKRRKSIESSFDEIGAFLMPSPGENITDKKNSIGCLQEIKPEFLKYLKELVSGLFAPEKLKLKKINGEQVRAREFVQSLKSYINIFNGNSLPDVEDILQVQIKLQNFKLYNDSLDNYMGFMKDSFDQKIESYLNESDLLELHQKSKDAVINEFLKKPKLSNDTSDLQQKIQDNIEQKFDYFKLKRLEFMAKVEAQNALLFSECVDIYTDSMQELFKNVETYIKNTKLMNHHEKSKNNTITQFQTKSKIDGNVLISQLLNRIQSEIDRKFNDFKKQSERIRDYYKSQYLMKYGWLEIQFKEFVAVSQTNGFYCDPPFFQTDCDPFITVTVDGKIVIETDYFFEKTHGYFSGLYTTGKIKKNSPIVIEMWDYDELTNNELILRWITNVEELISAGGTYTKYQKNTNNMLVTYSTWKDEIVELDD